MMNRIVSIIIKDMLLNRLFVFDRYVTRQMFYSLLALQWNQVSIEQLIFYVSYCGKPNAWIDEILQKLCNFMVFICWHDLSVI